MKRFNHSHVCGVNTHCWLLKSQIISQSDHNRDQSAAQTAAAAEEIKQILRFSCL